jgi:hypothetical protein
MAHNHGNEYQVKIVHADGTEELSEWMNSQEQVAQQAMAAVHRRMSAFRRDYNPFLGCFDIG